MQHNISHHSLMLNKDGSKVGLELRGLRESMIKICDISLSLYASFIGKFEGEGPHWDIFEDLKLSASKWDFLESMWDSTSHPCDLLGKDHNPPSFVP